MRPGSERRRRAARRLLPIGCGHGVDQESTSWAAACGPTPGCLRSCRREFARNGLDLASELAFLGLQLQHASSDRAEGEHAPTQLGIASPLESSGSQAAQQWSLRQRAQLTARAARGL